YDRFRRDAIERFDEAGSPFADRIVKICLLSSANKELIEKLTPFAEETRKAQLEAEAAGDVFQAAWRLMSITLFEYRKGDYAKAVEYSRACLAYSESNVPRSSSVRAVLAMSLYRMGRIEEAKEELQLTRSLFDSKFRGISDRGNPV